MEELAAEIGRLDMDAVTEQFGSNFGPRPDFFDERTVEDLKEEFKGLIDMEEVGGVFKSDSKRTVQFPMEADHDSEEGWSEARAEQWHAETVAAAEKEDLRANEVLGKKMGWEAATEESRQWYDQVQEEIRGHDPLADLSQDEYEHMSRYILELVHAAKSPDKFEVLVEENVQLINPALLTMLDRRIALAAKDGSDERVVYGLQKIWKRLAAEMERRDAPDELKLLDTCLRLMMPEDPMQEFDATHILKAKQEVVELLDEAFALPLSRHRPVDLFEMARKIGPQQDLDIDKLEAEHGDIWGSELSKESFISMVEEVIQETEERHVEEHEALKEIAHELETLDFTEEEKRMAGEHVRQMHRELDAQKRTVGVTREILRMTKAMTWV